AINPGSPTSGYVHRLEGEVIEPERLGDRGTIPVDHRGGFAVSGEGAGARCCVRGDLVKVDDAEAGQRIEWVLRIAPAEARGNGNCWRKPSIEAEVGRLRAGLVRQDECGSAGWLWSQADRRAEDLAGEDGEVCSAESDGDVLCFVNSHLDVHVKKTKTHEGVKRVRTARVLGVPEVRDGPGDKQSGQWAVKAVERVAAGFPFG